MDKKAKIYVAGHMGMVGSAISRHLMAQGYQNLLFATSKELDLRNQDQVLGFLRKESPEYVFLAAAKVGGIKANIDFPAEFLYDNLMIQTNLIHASYQSKVGKLLFLGSSCIYPRDCSSPINEDNLLSGSLDATNEPYAIAKISGIKLCQAYNQQYGTRYISLMPTNLYGSNDNFDLATSHVLPALIRKFHEAKINHNPSVTVWGTGKPKREFMHVDDLAEVSIYLMEKYDNGQIINVGVGKDISIGELALLIKDIVGYDGNIIFDTSKPDGVPEKLLDITRLTGLGWRAKIKLAEGIKMTYGWYKDNG